MNTIDASATDPGTAYVAADRHRLDEMRPVAFRTHDFGATWVDIARGLPQDEWLGALRQDPKRAGLLYAGTNRGVHVSFDDGESWQSLQLNLPTTGINDLLAHGDDLIVATQGRAIWALDVVEPLRQLAIAEATGGVERHRPTLLQLAPAVRLRANQNRDTPLPPEEPRGENPPTGAVIDYLLPVAARGPVVLEIFDAAGDRVRRFASDESPRPPACRGLLCRPVAGRARSAGDDGGASSLRLGSAPRAPASARLRLFDRRASGQGDATLAAGRAGSSRELRGAAHGRWRRAAPAGRPWSPIRG